MIEILISEAGLLDWPAIIAGMVGGLASGAAAGVAAWLVFLLGLREERQKNVLQDEKRRSELAFRGFIKSRDWLQHGLDYYLAVKKTLNSPLTPTNEMPKSLIMGAIAETAVQPERLAIEEFSFLATQNKAPLINDLYEIERWAVHIASLAREYSARRKDWDAWALVSSDIEGFPDDNNKVAGAFSGRRAFEAKIRTNAMDKILDEILKAGGEGVDEYPRKINDFLAACRTQFPSSFPDVSLKLRY